jgi:hypothetical protein
MSWRFGVLAMVVWERIWEKGRRKTGIVGVEFSTSYSRCLWSNMFLSGS